MITVNQLFYKGRKSKYTRDKTPALVPAFRKRKGFRFEKKPQAKGYCNKVFTRTPKKPNSAVRKLAKVKVYSTNSMVESYIPGMGHNLRGFSIILMRGGRTQDLPGLKYKCIRGKYDLVGVLNRYTARSRYGVKDLWKVKTKK